MQNDQIIQRIKKLIKHSESAKSFGSVEEAEAFATKANELLLEYNLQLEDIVNANDVDEFKNWIYAESISYVDKQVGGQWRRRLVNVITYHNLCSYTYNSFTKTFKVYGKMENVDTAVWLYHYLSIGLLRLAQAAHRSLEPQKKANTARATYLFHFLIGAVDGLNAKLVEMKQKHTMSKQINALMIRNDEQLERFKKKQIPNLVPGRKSKPLTVDKRTYKQGYEAGYNVSIGKPLESATQEIEKHLLQ